MNTPIHPTLSSNMLLHRPPRWGTPKQQRFFFFLRRPSLRRKRGVAFVLCGNP